MIFTTIVLLATPALAQEDGESGPATDDAAAAQRGANMPLTIFAGTPKHRAIVLVDGGYDGARKAGLLDIVVDARIWGPIRVRAGGSYVSSADDVRPTAGLMVDILNQSSMGLDLSAGVFYKPEGLTEPEGEIEGVLALGRTFGRTRLAGNFIYGQDGEGNERDGEVRGAMLVKVLPRLFVGGDARLRFSIGTPKKAEPDYDVLAGPVATVLVGGEFAVTAQAGVSAVGLDDTNKSGVAGLLGMSRVF